MSQVFNLSFLKLGVTFLKVAKRKEAFLQDFWSSLQLDSLDTLCIEMSVFLICVVLRYRDLKNAFFWVRFQCAWIAAAAPPLQHRMMPF